MVWDVSKHKMLWDCYSNEKYKLKTACNRMWTGPVMAHIGKTVILFYFMFFFASCKRTTISHVKSACPSVLPHWRTWGPLDGVTWNLRLIYFSKICKKFQFSLQCDKNNGDFVWTPVYIYCVMKLVRLRIAAVRRFLWVRWSFGLHKMRENSWLPQDRLVFSARILPHGVSSQCFYSGE